VGLPARTGSSGCDFKFDSRWVAEFFEGISQANPSKAYSISRARDRVAERSESTAILRYQIHLLGYDFNDMYLGALARPVSPSILPAFLRIFSSADNLRGGFTVGRRFLEIADCGISIDLEDNGQTATLSVTAVGERHRQLSENVTIFFSSQMMAAVRWFLQQDISFTDFTCKSPTFRAGHLVHPEFGCPVEIGDRVSFSFPSILLEAQSTLGIVREPVSESAPWLSHPTPFEYSISNEDVLQDLDEVIHLDPANLPVYRNVGARQKRRNLLEERGINIRELKHAYSAGRAKALLSTDFPMEELYVGLGYSEERSFRRFFKMRTGMTPVEYRNSTESVYVKNAIELTQRLYNLYCDQIANRPRIQEH